MSCELTDSDTGCNARACARAAMCMGSLVDDDSRSPEPADNADAPFSPEWADTKEYR